MIRFSIRHMVVATVHGRFDGPRGVLRFDRFRPANIEVEAEIDPATIDTGIGKRDDHLRSQDFFDVATFPTMSFQSTAVELVSSARGDRWRMVGNLTMHGVTRSVELDVRQVDPPGRRQSDVLRFTATCNLDRKDFGMTFNLAVEGGNLVVGNEVRVEINIKAVKAN
jgi:polyisoprenoid-binding protein YceI